MPSQPNSPYSFLNQGQPQPIPGRNTQAGGLPWGATVAPGDPSLAGPGGPRQLNATDIGFQVQTREAARENLQKAMSTANPEDVAAQDAIRSAFGERLQGLQGNMAQQKGQLESDLSKGFQNQVAEVRRQAGGTGTIGSSTYGSQIGDVGSQYQNMRAKALQDLQNQGLQELQGIQGGLQGVYGQDLQERGFQGMQANQYSQLLMDQITADQTRASGLADLRQKDKASERKFYSDLFGDVAGVGGQIAAPKPKPKGE